MGSCSKDVMPCAACKLLRRRCTRNCIFLPHFPPSEPEKFVAVHRVFGASNISKMLQEIPVDDRRDAIVSLVYEATARLKEPVYGSVALISSLQKQVFQIQSELNEAHAEILALRTQLYLLSMQFASESSPSIYNQQEQSDYSIDAHATNVMLQNPPLTNTNLEQRPELCPDEKEAWNNDFWYDQTSF